MRKLSKVSTSNMNTVEAFRKKNCSCGNCACRGFWQPRNRIKNNTKDINNMCS